jgi:hypothetical protein
MAANAYKTQIRNSEKKKTIVELLIVEFFGQLKR